MTTNSSSIENGLSPHYRRARQPQSDLMPSHTPCERQRLRWMVGMLALICVLFPLLPAQSVAASPFTPRITEYSVPPLPGDRSTPQGITMGSDGALWFNQSYDNVIGRITTKGSVTSHRVGSFTYYTGEITAGPDGALWFSLPNSNPSSTSAKIGRLTTAGIFTSFAIPFASIPWDITTGSDGNLYFTNFVQNPVSIDRITPQGQVTAFHFTDKAGGYPYNITAGPDGNLWFTDRNTKRIGKMTTAGKFTFYLLPSKSGSTDAITAGPDGAIWFTVDNTGNPGQIGRIGTDGTITEYALPNPNRDYIFLSGITAGPDGNLWFTYFDYNSHASKIGRITPSGTISLWPTPTAASFPTDIKAGPDGALWFTEYAVGKIGRITTH